MWTFAPTTERRVRETEIDGMYGAPKSNLFEQRYRAKPGYCKTELRNHRYRWKIERMFNRECLKFLDMPESSLKKFNLQTSTRDGKIKKETYRLSEIFFFVRKYSIIFKYNEIEI